MHVKFLIFGAALSLVACGGSDGGGSGPGNDGSAPPPTGDGSVPVGDGGAQDGAPIPDAGGGIIIETDAGSWVCHITTCNGKLLECGNCIDDDGDGLVDSQDPECLGPCDNTEGPTLNPGVGGETGATCGADCFWDFGNGNGNDGCLWDYRCDPLAPKARCDFDESRAGSEICPAEQPEMCQDFCGPLTPNGCDCFGCCTVPQLAGKGEDGGDAYVWIGAVTSGGTGTCTFADIEDPTKCPPCTPQPSCFNDCKTCELCVGKPDLPDECYTDKEPDAPPQECPGNVAACGLPGQDPCAPGFYCISGCCYPTVG